VVVAPHRQTVAVVMVERQVGRGIDLCYTGHTGAAVHIHKAWLLLSMIIIIMEIHRYHLSCVQSSIPFLSFSIT